MAMNTNRKVIVALWLLALATPVAAESALSGLAERAKDSSIDANVFVQDANEEVLRLLQQAPTDADLAAIPDLIDAFHRSQTDKQAAVFKVLAHLLAVSHIHRTAILDTATEALQSPSPSVRIAALDLLGRSEDAAVVPHLMASLSDPDEGVRLQALYGLSFLIDQGGHEELLQAIAAVVTDENERVRDLARTLMRLAAEAEDKNE